MSDAINDVLDNDDAEVEIAKLTNQREILTTEANAQGIASMLCAHGPEVEWRICTKWHQIGYAYNLVGFL
nr:hypothetical protein [Tanacetum cinerariifolium]